MTPKHNVARHTAFDRRYSRSSHLSMVSEGCGCSDVILSGKPSDRARKLDPRISIGKSSFQKLDGTPTNMNEVLGDVVTTTDTSLVIFLRSLG
jgi:hypothetical protein